MLPAPNLLNGHFLTLNGAKGLFEELLTLPEWCICLNHKQRQCGLNQLPCIP